jgi:protein-S-isoprenylcysteine O-methyltransferase Ste14
MKILTVFATLSPKALSKTSWWKGTHGEWYVVGQIALAGLVIFGPRLMPGWPAWTFPYTLLGSIAGGVLLLIGGLGIVAGIFRLGTNLTAVPYPKEQGILVETGPYRFVRHPMYSGAILMALGWAFWVHGWLTIGYAVILFVFFDLKARREEQWLKEKFSGYANYQTRVHKLIPFIY